MSSARFMEKADGSGDIEVFVNGSLTKTIKSRKTLAKEFIDNSVIIDKKMLKELIDML